MSNLVINDQYSKTKNPTWLCNYLRTEYGKDRKPKTDKDGRNITKPFHKAKLEDFFLAQVKRDGEWVTAAFVQWTSKKTIVMEYINPITDIGDFFEMVMDSLINGLQKRSKDGTVEYWDRNTSVIPSKDGSLQPEVLEALAEKLQAVKDFTATLGEEDELSKVEIPKSKYWRSIFQS